MTNLNDGFSFIWKIENFSMMSHRNGEFLESPVFVVESLNKTAWCLHLYPKGREGEDNYIALFMRRCDYGNTAVHINFTFALESVNSAFEKTVHSINQVIDDSRSRGYPKFMELIVIRENINLYAPQDILTIGCHLSPSQEQFDNTPTAVSNYFVNQHSAKTTIAVQRRVLAWPITNISELERSKEKISINLADGSKDFPALKLSFYIDKSLSDKHARIEIHQTKSSSGKDFFVKCKTTIVNSADKNHQTSTQDFYLFSSHVSEVWHFPDFILIDNIGEKYANVNDTMFLQCEFTVSCKGSEHHLEMSLYAFAKKEHFAPTELTKNIEVLFKSKQFCDVELRVGDQTFPCHKFILYAQSPVFRAMFENDMKEKETGVVEITDVDPKALGLMLKFMYLEVLEDGMSFEDTCNLYFVADKYEVLALKQQCSLLLVSKLSVENVCRVLVIADTHQDLLLWSHIFNFLSVYAREVFHSPQWKTFMVDNPTLSKDTMIKVYMEEPYNDL